LWALIIIIFKSTDREDVKIRLVSKNKEILHAKSILSKFPKWLRESEELIPEVGDWIEDISIYIPAVPL
jgi:hypothetical protein